METRISHSIHRFLRFTETWLLLAFVLAIARIEGHAQAVSKGGVQSRPSPAEITEWRDDVSGAVHFLHIMFPDVNPKSKLIIVNIRDWERGPGGIGPFTIYVCEPDSFRRNVELQQSSSTRNDIQCSALSLRATFMIAGSKIGPVPGQIMIGRPIVEESWNKLATLLI